MENNPMADYEGRIQNLFTTQYQDRIQKVLDAFDAKIFDNSASISLYDNITNAHYIRGLYDYLTKKAPNVLFLKNVYYSNDTAYGKVEIDMINADRYNCRPTITVVRL